MKATEIFNKRKVLLTDDGRPITVFMDLWELPAPSEGAFLEKYKLSWIAFETLDSSKRVLMDAHKPFGLHFHLHDGKRQELSANSIEEAFDIFFELVEEHFGVRIED